MIVTRLSPVIADRWLASSAGGRRLAREAGLVLAGSLLIAACAQVRIPMWPVPATLQSLAVLLIGVLFGARRGAATALAYLAEGAAGLPVFAGFGSGVTTLVGPTGGYLAAFPVAAWAVGAFVERGWDRRWSSAVAALVVGDVIILSLGFGWLAVLAGPAAAWTGGVAPFLLFNALKVAFVACLMPVVRRRLTASSASVG